LLCPQKEDIGLFNHQDTKNLSLEVLVAHVLAGNILADRASLAEKYYSRIMSVDYSEEIVVQHVPVKPLLPL